MTVCWSEFRCSVWNYPVLCTKYIKEFRSGSNSLTKYRLMRREVIPLQNRVEQLQAICLQVQDQILIDMYNSFIYMYIENLFFQLRPITWWLQYGGWGVASSPETLSAPVNCAPFFSQVCSFMFIQRAHALKTQKASHHRPQTPKKKKTTNQKHKKKQHP